MAAQGFNAVGMANHCCSRLSNLLKILLRYLIGVLIGAARMDKLGVHIRTGAKPDGCSRTGKNARWQQARYCPLLLQSDLTVLVVVATAFVAFGLGCNSLISFAVFNHFSRQYRRRPFVGRSLHIVQKAYGIASFKSPILKSAISLDDSNF